MCGLAGFIKNDISINPVNAENLAIKMSKLLKHRGPDNQSFWKSFDNEIYFSHSRLSILDLSNRGNQPMASKSGRYVISYNGEIYNHMKIREVLNQNAFNSWSSTCDTETLIEAIEVLGIEKTLNLIEGMFAFSLWDKKEKTLYLARDRFGQKPLYYGFVNSSFVFGSELNVIKCFPKFNKKISNDALNLFLNYSYIPEPYSIFENIYKLKPGEVLKINLSKVDYKNRSDLKNLVEKKKWFNIHKAKKIDYDLKNLNNCVDFLDNLLKKSISQTLVSDLPVGSFLSGGVDSSLVSAIAQKLSNKKIETFSVGFENDDFNEAVYAREVSNHIKSNHNELIISSEKIDNVFSSIIDVYDEPFADSSQIATSIISNFAREKVKVVLTGDGADELFGGYNRYLYIDQIWQKTLYLPVKVKKTIGAIISKLNTKNLIIFLNIINNFFYRKNKFPQFENKIEKISRVLLNSNSQLDMYFSLLKVDNDNIHLKNRSLEYYYENELKKINNENSTNDQLKMMRIDQMFYLTGDILHKVDRAAMNIGLETRIPFLNYEIYNFSRNIPFEFIIKNKKTKFIIKELSKRYLPEKVYKRRKMGFSIPLNSWIKKNSKKFISDFENDKDQFNSLNLNLKSILNKFNDHSTGKKDWSGYLWNLIILQNWLKRNI